jgi:hypothetical protein
MIDTYHTTEEISAILAAVVSHGDAVYRAWEAVTEEDRLGLVIAAAADLDACAWKGERASVSQVAAWPRVWARGCYTDRDGQPSGISTEAELPADVDAWSVAGLPGRFRAAHAIQAAHHAAVLLGADGGVTARLDEAARGIVATSGGGQSVSVDAARADRPRMKLHPRARQLVAPWLARSAEVV